MKRTNIYLDDDDRDALRVIRDEHGIATDASAVRFAVRQVARDIERQAKRSHAKGRSATSSGADGGES